MMAGTLRPDWRKRVFVRGWTDDRYTFARYFSPLKPNRPDTVEQLITDNDSVLYDRESDPLEMDNLAACPSIRTPSLDSSPSWKDPSTPRSGPTINRG